ncbi:A24 family peptidase [Streptomyces sp. AM 2-1-1]|uniref:prepilin peptidase n=1 Tax=Streptomyces sp. AM 2-1-1 TaxID=3028709 RepID=UPI0023B985BF|nr:A24 family peptidase [Streptomyces sp. AM 2-1-1]WEH39928.1 A24 family peptidase [Streptomyces sp. AM 2-1-1]
MDALWIAAVPLAAAWGAAAGSLIPRAAYRFSVQPEEEWRDACPAGHPLARPLPHPDPAHHAHSGPGPTAAPTPTAAPGPVARARPRRGRGWLGSARCAACAQDAASAQDAVCARDAPAAAPYAPQVLVAVVSAVACAVLAAATGARPELLVWLLLTPVAVLLAAVDHRVHRLPDALTLPLAGAAVLLLGAASLLPGPGGSWTGALLGGAALGCFYLVLYLINPNGMGRGDVKLALSLGVVLGWYGWPVLVAGGFAGFLYGAVYGFGLLVLRRAHRRTGIPFGPFMIAGALTGVVLGALR